MIGQGFRVEATEVITSEVHKRIRDLDVDPRADIQRSRELIRTVIAEYDERSLVADLPCSRTKKRRSAISIINCRASVPCRIISMIRTSKRSG